MKSLILKTLSLAIVAAGTFASTAPQAKADSYGREGCYEHSYCYREHPYRCEERCEHVYYREPICTTPIYYRDHCYRDYSCSPSRYHCYESYGCRR